MKKNKITRSMCVFIAATMLPLEAIVSLAAETAHTAVFGKPDEDVVQTTKNADIESVFSNSLDLICESESDTTCHGIICFQTVTVHMTYTLILF